MRFTSWLLVSLLCLTFTTSAVAQEGGQSAGREEFIAGSQAADEGRWSDSLSHFQQAYLLSGVPTALYNAAMALRALGRHREARDAFAQIVENHADSPAAGPAGEKRAEEAARVAVLTLAGLDASAVYEVRLDGRAIEVQPGSSIDVEADPGRRGLAAEREGFESWSWEGDLTDGERRTLTVEMVELEEESRSVLKSPVFWIIAGVLIVGAGVGLGLWLQNRAQLDSTYPDNALDV